MQWPETSRPGSFSACEARLGLGSLGDRRSGPAPLATMSCSRRPIRSLRLSAWRASCSALDRSPSSAFSVSACLRWRSWTSSVIRVLSCESAARSRPSPSRSVAISLRTLTSSERSATSVSTSTFMPGRTAPRSIAVRTETSASSGLTIRAGGGWRPIRWSAASTSAITARRLRKRAADGVLVAAAGPQAAFRRPRPVPRPRAPCGGADQELIELAPVLADRVELGLELRLDLGLLLLLGTELREFLLARAFSGLGRDRDGAGRLRLRRRADLERRLRRRARRRNREQAHAHRGCEQPRREAACERRDHLAKIRTKFIDEPLTFRVRRIGGKRRAARIARRVTSA